MSVASTVQLRSLATRRMTGNLSAISAIRLVEIRTAETQSGRRWDAPRKLIYVMTFGRTTLGINKTKDTGMMDVQIGFADAFQRVFPTMVASSPISRLDPPGDFVRPKFSNI